MPRVIALTGGIATGKSTVARMLVARGAALIDADALVRELQAPGAPLAAEIADAFGAAVLDAAGRLDRAALGALVFRDAAARRRLERIVHPAVGREMARRASQALERGAPLVVLDIPLLLELRAAGSGDAASLPFDAVVLVYAPEALQIERQVERNDYGRDEALRRVRAQLPIEAKRARADHVIDNSGSLAETERQVDALYRQLSADPPARAGRP